MRIVVDEHIATAVVVALVRSGHDVVSFTDVARLSLPDNQQLEWALQAQRFFVTHDSDYAAFALEGRHHAGIAYCHPEKSAVVRGASSTLSGTRWKALLKNRCSTRSSTFRTLAPGSRRSVRSDIVPRWMSYRSCPIGLPSAGRGLEAPTFRCS